MPRPDRAQSSNLLIVNGTPVQRKRMDDFVQTDSLGSVSRTPQYEETLPGENGQPGKTHLILQATDDGACVPVPRTLTFPNGMLCPDNSPVYTVPPDHYFMMGDNRDRSADSRFLSDVGYVPAEDLEGKAEYRFFSIKNDLPPWQIWKWPGNVQVGRMFQSVYNQLNP